MPRFGDKRNTNGFDKNPQNRYKGGSRPVLVHNVLKELKEQGYDCVTDREIKDTYRFMLNMPLDAISEMADKDSKYPMVVKLVAKELLSKSGSVMLERMLDRVMGKPAQSVDVTTKGDQINQSPLIVHVIKSKKDEEQD